MSAYFPYLACLGMHVGLGCSGYRLPTWLDLRVALVPACFCPDIAYSRHGVRATICLFAGRLDGLGTIDGKVCGAAYTATSAVSGMFILVPRYVRVAKLLARWLWTREMDACSRTFLSVARKR